MNNNFLENIKVGQEVAYVGFSYGAKVRIGLVKRITPTRRIIVEFVDGTKITVSGEDGCRIGRERSYYGGHIQEVTNEEKEAILRENLKLGILSGAKMLDSSEEKFDIDELRKIRKSLQEILKI